ncbi:MAG: type II secretion system protein [Phycisphaerae bacterium]|nr:type II secretion system protein [Phycisphaerae bacterium]
MGKKKGFTLIELLVVISIIALLVSILMPALSKARHLGKNVVCMSNMKQWGAVFALYCEDNDGRLFSAWKSSGEGHVWLSFAEKYWDTEEILLCPEWNGRTQIQNADFGSRSAWGVFPDADVRLGYANRKGCYGANSWVGRLDRGLPKNTVKSDYWQYMGVKGGNRVPLFMDARWPGGRVRDTDLPEDPLGNYQGSNAMQRYAVNRHYGHINATFLDYSVRSVGLKDMWKLKWNGNFNVHAYKDITAWPEWMNKL